MKKLSLISCLLICCLLVGCGPSQYIHSHDPTREIIQDNSQADVPTNQQSHITQEELEQIERALEDEVAPRHEREHIPDNQQRNNHIDRTVIAIIAGLAIFATGAASIVILAITNPEIFFSSGTVCSDGWISHSMGSGTCSSHGGIRR